MGQQAIFAPFFAMLLLTILVWCYMYAKRIPFLQSLDLPPDQITSGELQQRSPPAVANPSDNLKNLFELPILFYAIALYLFTTNNVDDLYVWLAWGFVLFRALHSAIHCTVNKVLVRFGLYATSSILLFIMIIRASIAA